MEPGCNPMHPACSPAQPGCSPTPPALRTCTEKAQPIALLRYHALVSAYATERPTQPPKTATSSRLNLKLIGSLACHEGPCSVHAVCACGARAVRVQCACCVHAVRVQCACSARAVRVRCACGALRCACGVRMQRAHGVLRVAHLLAPPELIVEVHRVLREASHP